MPKNSDIKNTVGNVAIGNSFKDGGDADLERGYFDPGERDQETAFEADTWYDYPSSQGGFVERPRWKSDVKRN